LLIYNKPYTYLIGWSKYDKWYYGVRFAKNCNTNELWKSYKTSSKHVKLFYETYGNPDIIQIRKTFENAENARLWENKVLKRLCVVKSERWLNKTDNRSISSKSSSIGGKNKPENFSDTCRKTRLGRKLSEETKRKISLSRLGMKKTEEEKRKISETVKSNWNKLSSVEKREKFGHLGENNWIFGKKHSDETKQKISKSKKLKL